MRLVHLSATSLFGRLSLSADLEPVTVVVGDNGSGKSSTIGIPRLALNGPTGARFPLLGESPAYDWETTASFDGGLTVGRWMRGGSHKASFRGIGGTLKEVQSRIDGSLGRAATWSIDAFLSLSPSKRQEWLEVEVLRGAGWESKRVWEALDAAGAGKAALEEVLTGGVVEPPDDSGRVLLTSVLAALREADRTANADALRLGAVVKNDDLEATKAKGPGGTVVGWRTRVTELDAKIGEARERRGVIVGKEAARDDLLNSQTTTEAELTQHLATDWEERVRTRAEELRTAAEKLTGAHAAGAAARTEHERATAARAELQTLHDAAVAGAAEARARVPKRTIPGELGLDDLTHKERPVVVVDRRTGAMHTDSVWRDTDGTTILSDMDEIHVERHALFDLRSLTALAPSIEAAILKAKSPVLDLAPLAEAARVAEEERDGLSTRLEAAKRAAKAASRKVDEAKDAYRAAIGVESSAKEALRMAEETRTTAGDREAALRARLEALATEIGVSLAGQIEALDEEIASVKEERDEAQRNADTLSDMAGAVAKREENRVNLQRAQNRRTRARELIGPVEATLSGMLGELVSPLEEPVSRITRAVLGADFRVELTGGATFWLVWPDRRAPIEASKSEHAVAMMALRCAVQQSLGGWRHLVLDDMENLVASRRTRFVEAMLDEVREGRLDNFIGACVEDGWRPPAGARVIARS